MRAYTRPHAWPSYRLVEARGQWIPQVVRSVRRQDLSVRTLPEGCVPAVEQADHHREHTAQSCSGPGGWANNQPAALVLFVISHRPPATQFSRAGADVFEEWDKECVARERTRAVLSSPTLRGGPCRTALSCFFQIVGSLANPVGIGSLPVNCSRCIPPSMPLHTLRCVPPYISS